MPRKLFLIEVYLYNWTFVHFNLIPDFPAGCQGSDRHIGRQFTFSLISKGGPKTPGGRCCTIWDSDVFFRNVVLMEKRGIVAIKCIAHYGYTITNISL